MMLRVLADDLTGALDAGACFAAARRPLPVHWRDDAGAGDDLVLDIETRSLREVEATKRLERHLPPLATAGLAFKKIDSLMRGNSSSEIAACASSPLFGSVVIAPAFPAQRRVTRRGQQYARHCDAEQWRPVGPNLLAMLARPSAGAKPVPVHIPCGAVPEGSGVFVCDGETEDDLRLVAQATAGLVRPTLWCGTAGLARALAGPGEARNRPAGRRIFAIIGSRHPSAHAQVEAIEHRWPGAVLRVDRGMTPNAATTDVRAALDRHGLALLLPSYGNAAAHDIRSLFAELIDAVARSAQIDVCFASGGSTLRFVLDAIGCDRLMVEDEIEAGIPLAHMCGGHWDGCVLVSKSGAFGTPMTVRNLIEGVHGEARP